MNNRPKKHLNHEFFNESVKQLCLDHGTLIYLKKNSILYDENSSATSPYVYYLAEGICSASGISTSGREQIFLYQKPGDLLGHVPYIVLNNPDFTKSGYRRPTIMTRTNCALYQIPERFFLEYMNNNLDFSIYLNRMLAHTYTMAISHLKQMQEDSVVSSICRLLIQIGEKTPEGLLIPKIFTYGEISKYLGIHEVTVSRVIGRLKQKSYLTRIPDGLLIQDTEKLWNLIHEPENFKYK